jgi:hypothetical protein
MLDLNPDYFVGICRDDVCAVIPATADVST